MGDVNDNMRRPEARLIPGLRTPWIRDGFMVYKTCSILTDKLNIYSFFEKSQSWQLSMVTNVRTKATE